MKFIITICLIFTYYLCGGPCVVEKNTFFNIATIEMPGNFFKQTSPLLILETLQITQPTTQIISYKRSAKRYRKAHRLPTACLQNNETNTGFCWCKTSQKIQVINHAFNPWLTPYLSLFALFRI